MEKANTPLNEISTLLSGGEVEPIRFLVDTPWIIHPSDCSIHEHGVCDCGGLKLSDYGPEDFVPTLVSNTGRFGFFVDHMGGECFISPEVLPPLTLAAIAAASDLPDVEEAISILRVADGVDFDDAREAIVSQFKALAFRKGIHCSL